MSQRLEHTDIVRSKYAGTNCIGEIIVPMARRAGTAVGALLACCNIASALNPSLDVSQYAHTAWTARDGAFSGIIQSVAQTPDGYLWLGMDSGLLRFDGVRFASWNPPGSQRLPSSSMTSLLVSRDGRLWIGTDKGLVSWKDGTLTSHKEMDGIWIERILEDSKGTVWVSGQASLSAGSARSGMPA